MRTDERDARVTRLVNAGVAALLVVAFLGHALFASAAGADAASRAPYPLLYCLLALAAVHIGLSVATTLLMWNDSVRPPSEKKKRHQVLKWMTGAVVLAVLCVHVVHPAVVPAVTWAVSAVLLAAFVWHGWTGMKSLARDLRVPGKAKVPLRIALVALALIAFLVMVVARL